MTDCPNQYTCAKCGGTFHNNPDWTDADIAKEYETLFTEEMRADDEPPAIVCDNCYRRMIEEYPPAQALADLMGESIEALIKADTPGLREQYRTGTMGTGFDFTKK